MTDAEREYHKAYRQKNKERISNLKKDYYVKNKDAITEYKLISKYGIGYNEYNKMFAEQNGCCKICNIHQEHLSKKLFVDHCHTTGKVRGLLCTQCNVLLGMAKDNKDLMIKAIAYLEEA